MLWGLNSSQDHCVVALGGSLLSSYLDAGMGQISIQLCSDFMYWKPQIQGFH